MKTINPDRKAILMSIRQAMQASQMLHAVYLPKTMLIEFRFQKLEVGGGEKWSQDMQDLCSTKCSRRLVQRTAAPKSTGKAVWWVCSAPDMV